MEIMDDILDVRDSLEEAFDKGKRLLRRRTRGQRGFSTLSMVLGIMLLGAIIITPILYFVITGQRNASTHDEVTQRMYAADTGIQDAMWKVTTRDLPSWMEGTWGSSVYDKSYDYELANQVNHKDVSVSLRGVWLLEGLESAKNGRMPHAELVTVGNSMSADTYKIVIMDNGITGTYWLERIGVWLPAGFEYVTGSSNLENLDPTHDAYIVPTVSDWKNGHTIIWDYDASAKKKVDYDDLPSETERRKIITFRYDPGGSMQNAFSWCRTNRNDIYLSWSGDVKQFQISSTASDPNTGKSVTIMAGVMSSDAVGMGAAINGDYVAAGNALVRDQNDDTFKERLYKETPGDVTGIPDSGTARKIMLYWTGWKSSPLNTWYQTKNWGEWTNETDLTTLHNLASDHQVNKVSVKVETTVNGHKYGPYTVSTSLAADWWQVIPGTGASGTTDPWTMPNGWFYSCYADVTDEVKTCLKGYMTDPDYADWNGEATYTIGHAEESASMALESILQGVWGSSASDVFVVGNSGTILHYDNISWSTVGTGASTCNLKSVWGSASDNVVYAVGDARKVGGNQYYTILRSLDAGATWKDLGGSMGFTDGANLRGIWGSAANDIWAVGEARSSGSRTYFNILHYDGMSWTRSEAETIGTVNAKSLYAVWGSASDDVWAAGANGVALHHGASGWAPSSSGTAATLRGVWGTADSDVWAVGSGGTIRHFNGSTWSGDTWTQPSGASDTTLCGVWGVGGTVYAVGYNSSGKSNVGVVWYYDGGSVWHSMNCGATKALSGIWGSGAMDMYGVGEATTGGTLIHYDGVDDNGDGSLWDPVQGGTKMYSYNASNHNAETVIAATDYPLGDPGSTYGDGYKTKPNYQVGHAGWSIVTIYSSPETAGHQLYMFETLERSGRFCTRTIDDIKGFLAPQTVLTEDDAVKITCFVGEGDQVTADGQLDGDNIYLNGDRLNNGVSGQASPIDDVWNSISTGSTVDDIDIDTFYIDGSSGTIQPGDSEATVTFETDEDVWNMVYMILSFRSDLSSTGTLYYIVR